MERAEFHTHAAFVEGLHALVQAACTRRLRRIVFVDPTFEDWPLDAPALLASLTAFVRLPSRQLLLVANDFTALRRTRPRLVDWRRTWAHAVQAVRPLDPEAELPTRALADRCLALDVRDRAAWQGAIRVDEPAVARWAAETDALAQRSVADFPAYVLGL